MFDFFGAHSRGNRCARLHRHTILDREYLLDLAVETLAQQLLPTRRVRQMDRDADAALILANAALQNITHAKLGTDLPRISIAPPITECGAARDHEQPRQPTERGGDFLYHSV